VDTGDGPELTERATHRHWSTDKVRWRDQDGARHVNNVAYAEYLENARAEFAIEHLLPCKAKGDNFTVRAVHIEYHGMADYPGTVEVGTCVVEIGNSSFRLGHGVFVDGHCVVTAETVEVHHSAARAKPLSDELRAVLESLRP
jgi:acyl-CoA thioester hydrolase